ncbi:MAG: glutamyl-tRNA reductase [Bacilli bacterium]
MEIIVATMNYEETPLVIREKFAFSKDENEKFIQQIYNQAGIIEIMLVSTCNRTEIYMCVEHEKIAIAHLFSALAKWTENDVEIVRTYFSIKTNRSAVQYVFEVCAGLRSLILGETQVLGQVRTGYSIADGAGTVKRTLHRLVQQSLRVAKQVHGELKINEHSMSVPFAAVNLMQQLFDRTDHFTVGVLGAGETAKLVINHLQNFTSAKIMIVNRTVENARYLVKNERSSIHPLSELNTVINQADVVITTVTTDQHLVTVDMLERPAFFGRARTKLMIDLGVPRNIAPDVTTDKRVILYTIDDLEKVVQINKVQRERIAGQAKKMLENESEEFMKWIRLALVTPLIANVHRRSDVIHSEVMESIQRKLPQLERKELDVIQKHMRSVQNQWLVGMIASIKQIPDEKHADEKMRFLKTMLKVSATEGGRIK